eukprot:14718348-Heterocapsa_arctica.AAC.1
MVSPVETSGRLQQAGILIGHLHPHDVGQERLGQRDEVNAAQTRAISPSGACGGRSPCVSKSKLTLAKKIP